MAKTNAYIARQLAEQQACLDAGTKLGIQQMCDYFQIALRDPEVMGKDVMGRARIEKIMARVKTLSDYFHTAFTNDVDADHRQEELDAPLRELFGKDFEPFYARYPDLKKQRYDKPRKGWV